jgi:hypothetical protein
MGRWLRPLATTALAVAAAAAFGAWFWWATTPVDVPVPPPVVGPAPPSTSSASERAVRPPPRSTADYIGDQTCAACHEEIARKFAASAMGRSLAHVHEDATLGTFDEEVSIRPGGKCVYGVRQVGTDRLELGERMYDEAGQLIYDAARPAHFSVGSGTHGRSYLTNHGGILTMSAITWYASGNRWDLSPGFVPDDPRGLGRRVIDECLACHAGRVATIPGARDRYAAQPFAQLAIGCENCHGPGKQHADLHAAGSPAANDPIVNPSRLPPAERESVCNQCHLQGAARIPRYGRTHFDFRPGERLEETLVVLVTGTGVADGKTEAVKHVQQMMSSRCYTASAGKLGCISCHDSHATVSREEAPEFYRQRCLACHEPPDCRLPSADRQAQGDSCFACHMPRLPTPDIAHTALTDHRVLARPSDAPAASQQPAQAERLLFFGEANQRLPAWEVNRATGLALVKHLLEQGRPPEFSVIESLLAPVLEVAPDDTRVMNSLTELALKRNNLAAAEAYARLALDVEPQNEAALVALTMVAYQSGRYADGLDFSQRALAINPTLEAVHAQRADMLRLTGRLTEGIEAAERALELSPRLLPVRQWLVRAYRDAGQTAKSEEQAKIHERMEAAPPAK